jgi:hypothetical protein
MESIKGEGYKLSSPSVALRCGSRMPGQLMSDVNEHFLISGTKPHLVLPILETGLNPRLSSVDDNLFGACVYLAEKASKIDQYTAPDFNYHDNAELRKLFYDSCGQTFPNRSVKKPGSENDLFYCMVVRTVLGWHMMTKDGTSNIESGKPIWVDQDDKRELAEVGTTKYRYHSLIALAGPRCLLKRQREFMIYHENQCYVEYIIAYRRIS